MGLRYNIIRLNGTLKAAPVRAFLIQGGNIMEYEYGYWTVYESTKERRARQKKEYREYLNRINKQRGKKLK